MKLTLLLLLSSFLLNAASAKKTLQIYSIDVEGGQATLFVTPLGESLLVDTGWSGNNGRDADRIVAAANDAGIKRIDYLWITHFHVDHVGGVQNLLAKFPVGAFVDHGPNRQVSNPAPDADPATVATQPDHLYPAYLRVVGNAPHKALKPGDHLPKSGERLPLKGVELTVVSGDGAVLEKALPGAGKPNAACAGVAKKDVDASENARSLGFVLTYGKFRVVDLGDLTWNKELDLVCPKNKLGTASLFIVSHHGMDVSNSPALVHGIQPRVAIMNNAQKKGGKPAAWETVKSSPGLEDFWQLQPTDGGADHNVPADHILNIGEPGAAEYLKITANKNGSFEILNPRNKLTKTYPAH